MKRDSDEKKVRQRQRQREGESSTAKAGKESKVEKDDYFKNGHSALLGLFFSVGKKAFSSNTFFGVKQKI